MIVTRWLKMSTLSTQNPPIYCTLQCSHTGQVCRKYMFKKNFILFKINNKKKKKRNAQCLALLQQNVLTGEESSVNSTWNLKRDHAVPRCLYIHEPKTV